jgi:hypothetical protein
MAEKKVWFITGADRGMGVDIAKGRTLCFLFTTWPKNHRRFIDTGYHATREGVERRWLVTGTSKRRKNGIIRERQHKSRLGGNT